MNKRSPGIPYFRDRRRINSDSTCTYVYPEKFALPVLMAATGNFAAENKLGEGGFGQVFKVSETKREGKTQYTSKH